VEWTISPWKENRRGAAFATLSALLLWILVLWLLPGEPLPATLLGLAVLGALAPGMASIQCRVDEVGVARRVLFAWDRRPWQEIRRARLRKEGLFVSPFVTPNRLDHFRGLFLPLPHRSAPAGPLVEAIQRRLARHGL
jgi:hypothetical protein